MAEISSEVEERIVMTPTKKGIRSTTIMMERKKIDQELDNRVVHVAGGQHKGIIINRQLTLDEEDPILPQLSLEFKVFLTSATTNTHTQESRQLRFWFKDDITEVDQMRYSHEFFKDLVHPEDFPRDYVGFIKKIMKLMQNQFPQIKKIEVELKQLDAPAVPPKPPRPVSLDIDSMLKIEMTEERLKEIIEAAYPSSLKLEEIMKNTNSSEEEVNKLIAILTIKGIIKKLDNHGYMRITQDEKEVKVVRNMPTVAKSEQPTIAIITSMYCEKIAVDAMIENKDTYVRYQKQGESNVYTLGNIGPHRIVVTKLPAVGHSRGARIAAGNTTTRLLGTFQNVEYVFMVGCGGGVPHYTNHTKHVRLGDVVVSVPTSEANYVYLYCDQVNKSENGTLSFITKCWRPPELIIQHVVQSLKEINEANPDEMPWLKYLEDGFKIVQSTEIDYTRPNETTDKLYMSIGEKDVIEVAHPTCPDSGVTIRRPDTPVIHYGAVAGGRFVVKDDSIRQEFATKFGVLAFDYEFDAVVESVFGNRKDNYVFIRGIADYKDGMRNKEWQSYAALAAAAYMKAVISAIPPPEKNSPY